MWHDASSKKAYARRAQYEEVFVINRSMKQVEAKVATLVIFTLFYCQLDYL